MNLACIILATICDLATIRDGGINLYRTGEQFSITGHVIAANARPFKPKFQRAIQPLIAA